jgi:hypothetical protein
MLYNNKSKNIITQETSNSMPIASKDQSFTLDSYNQASPFSAPAAKNQTNINNNGESKDNYNIITIVVIGVVSILGCLLLTGLAYLCYRNNFPPLHQSNSDIETTTDSPFNWPDVTVTEEEGPRGDRIESTHSLFLGQASDGEI